MGERRRKRKKETDRVRGGTDSETERESERRRKGKKETDRVREGEQTDTESGRQRKGGREMDGQTERGVGDGGWVGVRGRARGQTEQRMERGGGQTEEERGMEGERKREKNRERQTEGERDG